MQAKDKLKRVSKKDIIFFYEQLIMDVVGIQDFRIEITSASYDKKVSKDMKRLTIKFILTNATGRHYYNYEMYRSKDWEKYKVELKCITTKIKK